MQEKYNHLKSPLANKITAKGDEYLYFGGTAYLGIPQNKTFIRHYLNGIKKFGLNNGTSRSNNVQLGIYSEVEQYASSKFGAESALITSSGYLAAQLTVKNLSDFGKVSYAPATHPALWQNGDPQIIGSFTDWATQIVNEVNGCEIKNWILISNSMNNLYPERYDFSFIRKINKDKNIILIIDDSHGIGINNNGLSAFSSIPPCANVEVVIVASMAKALGIDAGIVLGSEKIISQLKQTNEFLGASPPSAAGLYAFMQSDKIYAIELQKLKNSMAKVTNFLNEKTDWHFIPEFPVFFSKNADLSKKLLKEKILISSFPYPTIKGEIVNRIVLSSWHKEKDIKKLLTFL
jgi:8-amino-7-oxononanoate synthase